MAPKTFDVDVFIINNEGSLKRKFNKRIQIKLEYDPQGLSLKLVDGESKRNAYNRTWLVTACFFVCIFAAFLFCLLHI